MGGDFAGDLDCSADGDLLAKDGAHADLEAVPGAGDAQAWPGGEQRRKMRIPRQVFADRQRIGRKVEQPPHAGDDYWQGVQLRKAYRHGEPVTIGRPGDEGALGAADGDGAGVGAVRYHLDTRNGPRCEEGQDGVPIIRRFVGQLQGDRARRRSRLSAGAAQGDRRAVIELLKGLIEPPHAAEAGRQRYLRHRKAGLVDQLLGEQYPARLGDGDGRGAQVPAEQPPQLAFADAEAPGQGVHVALVESAGLDQDKGPGDGIGGAAPGAEVGRGLRPAAQTGSKARLLRRRGRGIENNVFALGRTGGTDRAAIDAGSLHRGEEAPVEAGVAGFNRAVTGVVIEIHAHEDGSSTASCLAVFGHGWPEDLV